MVGLDAAGKTTILYKLKLGEIVTTIPTIGQSLFSSFKTIIFNFITNFASIDVAFWMFYSLEYQLNLTNCLNRCFFTNKDVKLNVGGFIRIRIDK